MKTTMNIEGMRCAGCAGNVERTLRRLDGVEDVKVNLEQKSAVVTHANKVESASLAKVINDIGFRAAIAQNAPASTEMRQ